MNADSTDILEATQGTTHGANLFAYCNNNPICFIDTTGESGTAVYPNYGNQEDSASRNIFMFIIVVFLSFIASYIASFFIKTVLPWLKQLVQTLTAEVTHKLGIDVPQELTKQMELAKEKADERGRSKKTNNHHIVAKRDTRAKRSRELLYASDIGINDPVNLVAMNQTVHWYIHTTLYHKSVEIYLQNAWNSGRKTGSSKQSVFTALQLLNVQLQVL